MIFQSLNSNKALKHLSVTVASLCRKQFHQTELTICFCCVQMGGLEAVLTGLADILPVKKHRYGRELLTAAVVFAAFCIALPNVTNVSLLNVMK